MNIAVRGKPLSQECPVSPITDGVLNLLNSLDTMITETPPIDQPQRFGNKAFKIWYEKLQQVKFQKNMFRSILKISITISRSMISGSSYTFEK